MQEAIFMIQVHTNYEESAIRMIKKLQKFLGLQEQFEIISLAKKDIKNNQNGSFDNQKTDYLFRGYIAIKVFGVDPIFGSMPAEIFHLLNQIPKVVKSSLKTLTSNTIAKSLDFFKSLIPEDELHILIQDESANETAEKVVSQLEQARKWVEEKKNRVKMWLSLPKKLVKSFLLKYAPEKIVEDEGLKIQVLNLTSSELLELIPTFIALEQSTQGVMPS